jgi:hypothetical protein
MWMRVTLLTVGALLWTGALAGPESRGQNFPLSLPTPEVSLTLALGQTGAQDTGTLAWGTASGELVVFEFENRTLWAHVSATQGTWFDLPVRVAGRPLEAGIEDYAFVGTPSGTLYVAYLAADPAATSGSTCAAPRTWAALGPTRSPWW